MTGAERTICPFCAVEVCANALVCRSCSRDIVVPEHLRAELAQLTQKRDQLRDDLEKAKAGVAARASWLGNR